MLHKNISWSRTSVAAGFFPSIVAVMDTDALLCIYRNFSWRFSNGSNKKLCEKDKVLGQKLCCRRGFTHRMAILSHQPRFHCGPKILGFKASESICTWHVPTERRERKSPSSLRYMARKIFYTVEVLDFSLCNHKMTGVRDVPPAHLTRRPPTSYFTF